MKSKTHEIKILTEYVLPVAQGAKHFEVRKNDRNYKEGDYLLMFGINSSKYPTNEMIGARVDYVLHGAQFGIEDGYCVMAITVDQQNVLKLIGTYYPEITDPNTYRERDY